MYVVVAQPLLHRGVQVLECAGNSQNICVEFWNLSIRDTTAFDLNCYLLVKLSAPHLSIFKLLEVGKNCLVAKVSCKTDTVMLLVPYPAILNYVGNFRKGFHIRGNLLQIILD